MDSESGSTPSGDTSSRPSDDSENDSPGTPPSFTHNHVVADCHLKNFNHVLDAFKSAAERLSTSHPSGQKYASLHALLLSWQDDDLGVATEVSNLGNVLRKQYAFDVQYWEIPIKRSTFELTQRVLNWTAEYEGEDELLLVYYAGHGWMDSSRQAIWSNRRQRDEKYAELRWSGCEEILHESVSDTLFLLDCCHAGSSVSQALKGFSETIAASGFEYRAPLPGPHSFTNALTRILFDWSRKLQPFTIAALHAEILTYLKIIPSDQLSRDGLALATANTAMEMDTFEWRRTPVHYIRSTYQYVSSIVLAPSTTDMEEAFFHLNVIHEPKPDNRPRVVLSISLTEDIRAEDAESCRRWLKNFPLPTQGVNVEGVFKSFSTVVLVSVALEVWDVLPEIPGCNFVCYSQSPNLLGIVRVSDSGIELAEPDFEGLATYHGDNQRIVALYDRTYEYMPDEDDEECKTAFRVYYFLFNKLLQLGPKGDRANRTHYRAFRTRLSLHASKLIHLCMDVLGELISREGQSQIGPSTPSTPQPRHESHRYIYERHQERLGARRELAGMEIRRFEALARFVFFELEQRLLKVELGDVLISSTSNPGDISRSFAYHYGYYGSNRFQ